jgi:DNA-binding NtrC family response regulator
VRELANVVERLVILCGEGRVGHAHVQKSLAGAGAGISVPRTADELKEAKQELRDKAVADIERAFLTEALRRNSYNVSSAAAETGMQRSNFQAMLRKYGLLIRDILRREGSTGEAPETPPEDLSRPESGSA